MGENKMRKVLYLLALFVIFGFLLMLMGKTVNSLLFLFGLITVVASSYWLGFIKSISNIAEDLVEQVKEEMRNGGL